MCKFFSFTTKGDGIAMYMPLIERIKIFKKESNYEDYDSHTSINDFFGLKGALEDKTNKYEADFITGKVVIDQMNTTDDSGRVQKWFNKFRKTKEFTKISEYANLDLRSLQSLPENIKFPDTINGSLDLRSLQSLPENIKFPDTIKGYLYLSSLPKSFHNHKGLKHLKHKI